MLEMKLGMQINAPVVSTMNQSTPSECQHNTSGCSMTATTASSCVSATTASSCVSAA